MLATLSPCADLSWRQRSPTTHSRAVLSTVRIRSYEENALCLRLQPAGLGADVMGAEPAARRQDGSGACQWPNS
jgi:hypothetical protein